MVEHITTSDEAERLLMERKPERSSKRTMSQQSKVEPVQLEYFQPNPFQPRLAIDTVQLAPLVNSIQRFGFIGHVEARYDPNVPGGRLQLVFGHRRFRAAEMAGLKTIPTRIVDRTDAEMREIAYIENVTSVGLTYWEEGVYFRQMQTDMKLTLSEIADLTGKARGYVQNRLDVLRLPEGSALRAAAQSSDIDMTSAVTLLHLFTGGVPPEKIDSWVEDLKAGKIVADDLKKIRKARNMGFPIDEVLTESGGRVHTVPLDPLHFIPPTSGPVTVMTPVVEQSLVDAWEKAQEDMPPGPDLSVIAGRISQEIARANQDQAEAIQEAEAALESRPVHDRTVFAPKTGREYAIETLAQIRMILPHLEQRARRADFSTLTEAERSELHSHKETIAELIPV